MQTEVTRLLGIQYPIIQGGMAWVAEYHLAAGVSNAGGLGLIGAASAPAEWVREQIREARKLTDKPFGVNIMLMSPYADQVAKVVAEEGVKVVTTGAGNPEKYMEMWKAAGVKVIPVVASVALARRMERCGADAVVAEGCEAGGHIGGIPGGLNQCADYPGIFRPGGWRHNSLFALYGNEGQEGGESLRGTGDNGHYLHRGGDDGTGTVL